MSDPLRVPRDTQCILHSRKLDDIESILKSHGNTIAEMNQSVHDIKVALAGDAFGTPGFGQRLKMLETKDVCRTKAEAYQQGKLAMLAVMVTISATMVWEWFKSYFSKH